MFDISLIDRDPDKCSLEEEIVDSYGTFIPLLTFNNIQSRCRNPIEDDQVEDETFDEPPTNPLSNLDESKESYTSTKGKPVLQSHPYIITRFVIYKISIYAAVYIHESYVVNTGVEHIFESSTLQNSTIGRLTIDITKD